MCCEIHVCFEQEMERKFTVLGSETPTTTIANHYYAFFVKRTGY